MKSLYDEVAKNPWKPVGKIYEEVRSACTTYMDNEDDKKVFLSNIPNLKTIFSDLCKYREDMVLWLHKREGNCGGKSTKMLNFNPKFASTD